MRSIEARGPLEVRIPREIRPRHRKLDKRTVKFRYVGSFTQGTSCYSHAIDKASGYWQVRGFNMTFESWSSLLSLPAHDLPTQRTPPANDHKLDCPQYAPSSHATNSLTSLPMLAPRRFPGMSNYQHSLRLGGSFLSL